MRLAVIIFILFQFLTSCDKPMPPSDCGCNGLSLGGQSGGLTKYEGTVKYLENENIWYIKAHQNKISFVEVIPCTFADSLKTEELKILISGVVMPPCYKEEPNMWLLSISEIELL